MKNISLLEVYPSSYLQLPLLGHPVSFIITVNVNDPTHYSNSILGNSKQVEARRRRKETQERTGRN